MVGCWKNGPKPNIFPWCVGNKNRRFLLSLTLKFVLSVLHLVVLLVQLLYSSLHFVQVLVQFLWPKPNLGRNVIHSNPSAKLAKKNSVPCCSIPRQAFNESYSVLFQVSLFIGLRVLQIFVYGGNLPFLVIDGLIQRFQLFLDPFVPLFFRGELAASALFGIQVCSLLRGLSQSGKKNMNKLIHNKK